MSELRTALKFSMLGNYAGIILNLATVVMVARLLTPDEIGLFAIASALVLVVAELKSFGASGYIIKAPELTADLVRSSLGVSMIMSWSVAALVIGFSYQIEDFYGTPDLAILIQMLGFTFILAPWVIVGMGILMREFQFGRRMTVGLTSQSIRFISTFVFIELGYSYFALGMSAALVAVVEVVLIALVRPPMHQWWPKLPTEKEQWSFGMFATGSMLLSRIQLSIPDLVIGRLGSTTDVAYYSRAAGFLDFVLRLTMRGISPVAAPYFARAKRHSGDVAAHYAKASMLSSALLMPAFVVAGVASGPVIEIFFGPQWAVSSHIVSALSVWAILRAIHAMAPPLMLTMGLEKWLFFGELLLASLTFIVIVTCFGFGLVTMSWVLTSVAFTRFVYITLVLKFGLGFSILEFNRAMLPTYTIVLGCFIAAYATTHVVDLETNSAWVGFSAVAGALSVTWLVLAIALKHPIVDEVKRLLGRKT